MGAMLLRKRRVKKDTSNGIAFRIGSNRRKGFPCETSDQVPAL